MISELNTNAASSLAALRKRIQRFLVSTLYHRSEIANLIEHLTKHCRVAIFGGMLRDLCLGGSARFWSDVDIVTDDLNSSDLARVLGAYRPIRNSFGGFRISLTRWRADVWPLNTTWAFREGYVSGQTFADLIHTTFFNWDAIVYEVTGDRIICFPGYLNAVRKGLLDINLEPNPSPLKCIVRTMRLWLSGQAMLAPPLAKYVARGLSTLTTQELRDSEANSYHSSMLTVDVIQRLQLLLEVHLRNWADSAFPARSKQLRLAIPVPKRRFG